MPEIEAELGATFLKGKGGAHIAGRRKFTRQFKISAVKMVTEEGHRPSHVARTHGIGVGLLGRWLREFSSTSGPTLTEQDPATPQRELERLRDEMSRHKVENEVLKDLVGYFARKNGSAALQVPQDSSTSGDPSGGRSPSPHSS